MRPVRRRQRLPLSVSDAERTAERFGEIRTRASPAGLSSMTRLRFRRPGSLSTF